MLHQAHGVGESICIWQQRTTGEASPGAPAVRLLPKTCADTYEVPDCSISGALAIA